MNEIAKALWDKANGHLEEAEQTDDVNTAICETGLGELALKLGRFAVEHPELVLGLDAIPMPPGVVQSLVPPGPVGGPRVWGTSS